MTAPARPSCRCGDRWCMAGCGEPITCVSCGKDAPKARCCGMEWCQPCADFAQGVIRDAFGRAQERAERDRTMGERREVERQEDRAFRVAKLTAKVPPPEGFSWAARLRARDSRSKRYSIGFTLQRGGRIVGRLVPANPGWRARVVGARVVAGVADIGSVEEAARLLVELVTRRVAPAERLRIEAEPTGEELLAELEAKALEEQGWTAEDLESPRLRVRS